MASHVLWDLTAQGDVLQSVVKEVGVDVVSLVYDFVLGKTQFAVCVHVLRLVEELLVLKLIIKIGLNYNLYLDLILTDL